MNSSVQIGTCGLSGSKAAYAELFSSVEIQLTFYQPPHLVTLEKWRNEVPLDFEFTMKAWQLITHPAKSPTYKRLKRKLLESERSEVGYFKPTSIVEEAWQLTLACAQVLRAKTILFQCPASFTQTPEHVANLVQFFSRIKRNGLNCCWEPRGSWDKQVVKALCEDLDLWHVIDPFVQSTMTPERCYFRLHGRQGWRYQYEAAELGDLVELLPEEAGYVFFNNIHMRHDALLFKQLVNSTSE